MDMNLATGARAQRKTLITVAEWTEGAGPTPTREILGVRTEDSSIEFNPDVQTSTDILGTTYTDVNKTEPQQTFDPYFLIGGSTLGKYLFNAAIENNIAAYNGKFTIYVIAAFISETTGSAPATVESYKAVKHSGCTIVPQSVGGDAYASMPIDVYFSNSITVGSVDKLGDEFVFTADA